MPARKRRALVIAVVTAIAFLGSLVLAPAHPALAASNLLANPGFEYGDDRFWSSLRANVVADNAHTGQHAVRLSADETSVEQTIDVLPHTSYTVRGWAKTDSKEVWIGVKNFGGVETNVRLTSAAYTPGSLTFTTGPTARTALVYFFKYSVGNTAYGDDFEVVPTASLATDRVANGGFENGFSPWASFNSSVVAEQARTGRFAARLSGGESSFEQTITGLSANTTYTLSGWAKTSSLEAWIGVKHFGGTETNVKITSPAYVQGSVRFTTGPSSTTARIYFFKHTVGNTAYGDDFTVTPTPADPPEVWTESSLVSVFKDSRRTAVSGSAISLVAARNEYEFGQLALRSNGAFDITSVTLPDLVSGTNRIPAGNLRSKYVDYAFIANSSPGLTNTARTAPAYFPEYLRNDATRSVPGNTTQPISVTVFVPPTTPAGTYRGTVNVNTSAGDRTVPISVEVANVTLPDAKDGALSYANYTFLFGFQGEPDQVARFYPGIGKYSPEWWDLMEEFADDMREHRMNVQWVPTVDLLFDAGSTVAADGTATFDWEHFDQVVDFLLKRGVTKRLLGECFLLKNTSRGYDVWGLQNVEGRTVRAQLPFGGQAEAFARQYLPALKSHLVAKGWWDEWWMTLGDEPQFDGEWSTMRRAYDELIEPYAPGMRLSSPHFTAAPEGTFEDRLSVYVPQLDLQASNPTYYRERQAAGDEVWTYVCQVPRGDYFNRFIELPLARSRFMQWYNFGAGVTGTLHWAYSNWKHGVFDPGLQVPPGDTAIVWPDPINGTVMGTLRHDATRDGIEEYELLAIIARTDPARAHQLATAVAPGPTMGQHDTVQLQLRHNELVRAAAGL